jgi:1-phosphofructokinase
MIGMMGMIVTVTPNPSLDRTLAVPELRRGEVLRATTPADLDPSGKGINVSRTLAAAGQRTRAVLPLGGAAGRDLADLLDIDHVAVPIAEPIRSNVSVVEPDGTVTKLNEPGPVLTAAEADALLAATREATRGAEWLAACGSLPLGVPTDFYADLVRTVDVPVALDSSGAALRAGLAAGPRLVKPNTNELAEAVDRPLWTLRDVVAAATQLRAAGVGAVLASLGADGALLLDGPEPVYGRVEVPVMRSAVGAGDALLGGFLAGGGSGPKALAEGLAWAAAACALPGTAVPDPADVDRTAVTIVDRIDLDQRLGRAA